MRYLMTCLVLGILASSAAELRAESEKGEIWVNDIQAAMQTAAKEKKHLLLDFTGSDWCGWCIKLNNEVFSKEQFQAFASKKFVLVELDFPRDESKVPPAIQKQNQEWQQKLGVRGFPTIFLCTADGKPYAQTGYQQGGAENYVKHLSELVDAKGEMDKLQTELAKATGAEKAKLIDKLLTAASQGMVLEDRPKLMAEVVSLDPENKLGLRSKYETELQIGKIRELAQKRKFDEALAAVDKTMKELKIEGEQAQQLLFLKAQLQLTTESYDGALVTLDEAVKAAPDSEMASGLKQLKGRVELFVKQVKAEQEKEKAQLKEKDSDK